MTVTAAINGAGCVTILPYGSLTIDGSGSPGPQLSMPSAWLGVASAGSSCSHDPGIRMMWRWIAIALLVAAPAFAAEPLNNFIVPTAPVGTSNNQAASTAFVAGQIAANAGINVTQSPYNAKCDGATG